MHPEHSQVDDAIRECYEREAGREYYSQLIEDHDRREMGRATTNICKIVFAAIVLWILIGLTFIL